MKKIYIVEDDRQITQTVATFLKKWSFDVQGATDFQNVAEDILQYQPDLVLMDISLPLYNGFHWCSELRKHSDVPIVFLSSANDNMNILMAMNMGADDFIAKPFDLQILVAKIQAILRRSEMLPTSHKLNYQEFTLDLETFEVALKEQAVALTINESKILGMLFQQPEKLVPKEKIMEKLWESEEFIDANTLSVNMTRLRKKVAEIGLDKQIYTEKGKGYRLGKGV
ncbi:response regulator transcription factor [Enterococcus rotai]|uniref:response regulator transcription factor n=1 Tax=Enterococcus rotai TaxID=118060 RepID=UPI0032B46905